MLESAYERALMKEFQKAGMPAERQVKMQEDAESEEKGKPEEDSSSLSLTERVSRILGGDI